MEISKKTARRFIVKKQGFVSEPSDPSSETILETLRKVGCIQLDTINVIERSHYLVMWSRTGPYRRELLDKLLFPDRKVFEYWAHAACIIPFEYYRYFIHSIKEHQESTKDQAEKWLGNREYLLDEVLKKIRKNGPMSSKDFADERKERGRGWWDWKPAKIALELLFWGGRLMVDHREKFQRYYDLTENVLPSNVDVTEPTEEERKRFFILKTADAWGLVRAREFSDYYVRGSTKTDMKTKTVENIIQQLIEEEFLTEVMVDEAKNQYYLLNEDADMLQAISKGDSEVFEEVAFLSPFDNMTWCKPRIRELFGFSPKLETYVPRQKRKYGYYSLNILHKDKFVGRIDPKLHRKENLLEIKSLHLEREFTPDDAFKEKFVRALLSLKTFLNAEEIEFSGQCPKALTNLT